MLKQSRKYYLMGIDEHFTFVVLETNSDDLYQKGMEINEEENVAPFHHLWTAESTERVKYDFNFHYFELINRMYI